MENSKYYVISNNDVEFVIEVLNNEYILKRTKSTCWSDMSRGEEVLRIKDTKDGLKINKKISKDLKYYEAGELHLLLNFIYQVERKTFQEFKFLKEV